ncbi:MAG: hypothetical protein JSS65_05845 [Armatimonadetes bacterium]|nr:hypothetical protein [Armatimonadota bacterium]
MQNLLALALIVVQTAKTVDLEIPSLRADYAVAALGKAAGLKMEGRPGLQDSTVALSLQGATVDEVMQRLAKGLGANWSRDGETLVLDRPALTAQARTQARGKFASAALKKFLDPYPLWPRLDAQMLKDLQAEMIKARAPGAPHDLQMRAAKLADEFRKNDPEQRMLVRLAKSIGPSVIGSVPAGERKLFSLRPTAKQVPIPSSVADFANAWINEERLLFDYTKSIPEDQDGYTYSTYRYRYSDNKVPDTSEMSELWFIVENSRSTSTMWVDAFKADGSSPFSSHSSLTVGLNGENDMARQAKPIEVEGRFAPSARARFGHLVAQYWNVKATDRNVMKRDLPGFADETQGDTMLAFEGETLVAWAKAQKENLVAVLPERMAGGNALQRDDVDISSVVTDWSRGDRAKVEHKSGWMTVVPADPVGERSVRFPRREFFYLLDKGLQSGKLGLDDLADVATRLDDSDFAEVYNAVGKLLGIPTQNGSELTDVRALRLYGFLDKPERARVKAGEAVEVVSSRSGPLLKEVDRVVFQTRFRVVPSDYPGITFGKEDDLGWMTGNTWAGGPRSEASHVFGSGLPVGTRLVFQKSSLTAVRSKMAEDRGWTDDRIQLVDNYLRERAMQRQQLAQYDKERVAAVVNLERLAVKVDFGDKSWGQVNMIWPDDLRPASFVTPSSVLAQFPDKYAEELKKFGGGG